MKLKELLEENTQYAGLASVRAAWADLGIDNYISENAKEINLSQIVVPKTERNSGVGTKAMRMLTDYADAQGKRIVLTPSSDFGGSKARLITFYKRFGFVENKGRNKDFTTRETMIRNPKSAYNLEETISC
jgi:GNAT superfamily N-acetyltransferase